QKIIFSVDGILHGYVPVLPARTFSVFIKSIDGIIQAVLAVRHHSSVLVYVIAAHTCLSDPLVIGLASIGIQIVPGAVLLKPSDLHPTGIIKIVFLPADGFPAGFGVAAVLILVPPQTVGVDP